MYREWESDMGADLDLCGLDGAYLRWSGDGWLGFESKCSTCGLSKRIQICTVVEKAVTLLCKH